MGDSPEASGRRDRFEITLHDGTKTVYILTWFDKIMRLLLSKEEFEARMLEKREKVIEKHKKRSQQ